MKPRNASATESNRSHLRGLSAVDPREAHDQLHWKFTEDLLFVVRSSDAGSFVYEAINPAFEAIIGIASDEIRGIPVSDVVRKEDAPSVNQLLDTCLAEGAEVRLSHRLTLGEVSQAAETVIAPIHDPLTGAIVNLIGSHRMRCEGSHGAARNLAPDDYPSIEARLASIQEDIQQRIASDLHDSTCQHLIAASLGLMRMRASLGEPARAGQLCDEVDASIDRALREIRSFTYLLHPQDLMVSGLKATVEQYAEGFATRTSLKINARISPKIDRQPYETQRSLFRVVQEALTNVFRHAKATKVDIAIDEVDEQFEFTVRDDGCGMQIASDAISHHVAQPLGVGIRGMRARLEQIGGALEIRSQGEDRPGTMLRAVFPRSNEIGPAHGRRIHSHPRKQVLKERVRH